MGHQWSVAEAKAKFSELVARARAEGPQTITKNGKPEAILVGIDEWERKMHRDGSLAEFFARSPLRGSGMPEIVRDDLSRDPLK